MTLSIAFGENADVFSTSITYGDNYRGLNLRGPRVAGSDYLAFECSGTQGFAGFDFSHIPGGFGIYRLPYDIDLGQYAVDGLECVLPLDPLTTEDITLCPSSDGDYLLAAVRDSSGAWTLYLIEGASGRIVQAMPLFDEGEELFIEPQGDFVVFTAVSFGRSRSQSLLAAEYSPGRLEAAVRVDGGVQPALDDDTYVFETVYALDASSRRLALVNLLWTELYPPLSRPNALEIGIYSADGLEYLERVDLGLPVWDADYPRLSASFG